MVALLAPMEKLTDRQLIIPADNPNRPGAKVVNGQVVAESLLRGGTASWLTVHETANLAATASAFFHYLFLKNGGGAEEVSFHATVDHLESIQLLPWNEVAYHAGDGGGNGNYDSIGIETCVNAFPANFADTMQRLALLVHGLRTRLNIPLARVLQHHDWSSYHKNCPTQMRAQNGLLWNKLVGMLVKMEANGGQVPQVPPGPAPVVNVIPDGPFKFPETGYQIEHGFKDLWFREGIGLFVAGYPISVEYGWKGLTVQDFENVRFEYDPSKPGSQPRIGGANREYVDSLKAAGLYVGH